VLSWLRPGARDASRPDLAQAGALALHALLGLLPCAFEVGRSDPHVLPVWWALVALPLGVHAGARGAGGWPYGLLPPIAWMLGYGFCSLALLEPAPSPAWCGLAACGLWSFGLALGAWVAPRARGVCAAALFACAICCALPIRAGRAEHTWAERSPRAAALLLDLSPATLLVESAGLDWMRHRAIYHPAGTDWFSDRRAPYRGALASPLVFVLGWALALLARRRARAAH